MDVSDRRMQVQLTQEAKIASDFLYIRAIFAVVGFVSALSAPGTSPGAFCFAAGRALRAMSANERPPRGALAPEGKFFYNGITKFTGKDAGGLDSERDRA